MSSIWMTPFVLGVELNADVLSGLQTELAAHQIELDVNVVDPDASVITKTERKSAAPSAARARSKSVVSSTGAAGGGSDQPIRFGCTYERSAKSIC